MRIALLVAYDGTAYGGWQIQKNKISVQQAAESRYKQRYQYGNHRFNAFKNVAAFKIGSSCFLRRDYAVCFIYKRRNKSELPRLLQALFC